MTTPRLALFRFGIKHIVAIEESLVFTAEKHPDQEARERAQELISELEKPQVPRGNAEG